MMGSITQVVVVDSEQQHELRRHAQRCYTVDAAKHGESCRRAMVTRKRAFIQRGRDADLLVNYLEGREPMRSLGAIMGSDHPFDRELVGRLSLIYRLRTSGPMPPLADPCYQSVEEASIRRPSMGLAFPLDIRGIRLVRRMTDHLERSRSAAHASLHERLGFRENWYLQKSVTGNFTVLYLEADDVPSTLSRLAESKEPHDRWYRDQWTMFGGVDWTLLPSTLPIPLFDWTAE